MINFEQGVKVWTAKNLSGTIAVVIPKDRKPIKVIFRNGETGQYTGNELDPLNKLYLDSGRADKK